MQHEVPGLGLGVGTAAAAGAVASAAGTLGQATSSQSGDGQLDLNGRIRQPATHPPTNPVVEPYQAWERSGKAKPSTALPRLEDLGVEVFESGSAHDSVGTRAEAPVEEQAHTRCPVHMCDHVLTCCSVGQVLESLFVIGIFDLLQ